RSLLEIETARARAEVFFGRRLDSEHLGSELGDVEIELEDPLLRQAELEQHGEIRLERFAHEAAALPQEQILRDLLRDRRSAAQAVAAGVVLERAVERHEVDAV